ncbi:acyl-CoA dehydrogenase family protein [Mesorhizobium ventifaucium]|uniref:L-prolyl-(Peptidyl-carrier protein) dehydrogenase n=1 Tax=Mesorhizobium ventifaucium TaxID=666020 RepID=A0ABN8JAV9_9HYPH|nr:acyl-CoA dehydrogenase family protein [Mesorhizobium ventifaucium]CAH2395201.1 L-prolyl-(peptidyl-carrier protein) dehydrogenase [Mesorhizobium ventifaucium]
MDFALNEEQRILRGQILRFAQDKLNKDVRQRDRDQVFQRELWGACAQMGLTGLPVPQAYGGAGLDSLSTAIAIDALGYGCEDSGLVFSICAHLLACVVPIWKFGTEEQKNRYLPGLCDGTLIAANAMSEPESGSDAFAMQTRAEPHGDGFLINGTKTFVSNGPVADVAVVFAVTDRAKGYFGGITSFLVDRALPGYRVAQKFEKMGLRTSPIGELVFEDVFVSKDAVLGGVGGGSRLFAHSMDWERACLFASHIGTMERLLEKAVAYTRTRRQSGQAISKHQAVAHKIADMKMQVEAARLLVYKAAWGLERSQSVSLDAAVSKLFVSESLVRTTLDVVQVFGGYGFLSEFDVERAVRDAIGSKLYSGTSEIQRNIIAGWLGL